MLLVSTCHTILIHHLSQVEFKQESLLLRHHVIHKELTNAQDRTLIITKRLLHFASLTFRKLSREQLRGMSRLVEVSVDYSNYLSREGV